MSVYHSIDVIWYYMHLYLIYYQLKQARILLQAIYNQSHKFKTNQTQILFVQFYSNNYDFNPWITSYVDLYYAIDAISEPTVHLWSSRALSFWL